MGFRSVNSQRIAWLKTAVGHQNAIPEKNRWVQLRFILARCLSRKIKRKRKRKYTARLTQSLVAGR